MEQGWDPDIRQFFIRLLNGISITLIWALAAVTAGLYFELAIPGAHPAIVTIIFYIVLAVTFFLLVRSLYRKWYKKG